MKYGKTPSNEKVSGAQEKASGAQPGDANRGHKESKQAEKREASWLKEVRKVKRVEESEKWVTRPRGGRSKKQICWKNKTKTENDWWEGKKSEKRFKKNT